MNPFLSKEMAQQHIRDLRREARSSRVPEDYGEGDEEAEVTVRSAVARDYDALLMLAALEGVHLPDGPMVVADVKGDVVAALPLEGGRALADPFRETAHIVALLDLRARQLRPRPERWQLPLLARLRGTLHPA